MLVRRVARTPPRIRPQKGRQAEGRVRAALPHWHGGRRAPSRLRAGSASALHLPLRPLCSLLLNSRDVGGVSRRMDIGVERRAARGAGRVRRL
jgi:hypothetical protein